MILGRHSKTPVLIVGAGLAGLSTAYHLKKTPCLVVEKEKDVGGLARSFFINGFTFDFTGHLLHLHHDYTRGLIGRLLKGNVNTCYRNAWIYSHQVATRYPFQAYTYGLPPRIVDECLLGFLRAFLHRRQNRPLSAETDFREWCLRIFGEGISKHFMIPYNEKLFQTPATRMIADWCGPFVPMPKLEDVTGGAVSNRDKAFGYNPTFLYPKKGGVQALPLALAKNIKNIAPNSPVVKLDWKKKGATLATGKTVSYRHLVNTIPLPELLHLMAPLPPDILNAKKQLRWASILCLNVGVNRPHISEKSWIYFPEKKYPYYRVGFSMNFSSQVAPPKNSSMYIEIPWRRIENGEYPTCSSLLEDVRRALVDCRILKKGDDLPAVQYLPIPYAYIIPDRNRPTALATIFSFLEKNGIQSIGRYGAWKYSFMEEAILDGKNAAEKISRHTQG
ncbi:MAG: FAD-dependent oxidoreductase [Elusimicrobia bacterium]|nr:FAD-dependent oxidoreductase [Candidatus Obscuribacterium magneticum]